MILVGGDPNPDYLYLSEILAFGRLRNFCVMLGYKEKYKGGQKNRERRGSRSTQREEGRGRKTILFGIYR